MLDFDGDGRSDFVAMADGIGVLVGRDNGKGSFDAAAFWPFTWGIRDISIGSVQGNGKDDIAICLDHGVLLMLYSPIAGFVHRALLSPPRVGPLASARIVDVDGRGRGHVIGFPKDGRTYVFHDNFSVLANMWSPLVHPAHPHWSSQRFPGLRAGNFDANIIITDVDNDQDVDALVRTPDRTGFMTLRNPFVSLKPVALKVKSLGALPTSELSKGTAQEMTVTVPPLLWHRGFTAIEAAFFVADPDSKSLTDPDYIYWGRITVPIRSSQNTASFTTYLWEDDKLWDARVRMYKKQLAMSLNTQLIVFPQEVGTIRFSRRGFVSVHGYNGGARAESEQVVPDPGKGKSTLGPRWVLKANPPKPKADRQLLPWD
jgi:hypothetical protein